MDLESSIEREGRGSTPVEGFVNKRIRGPEGRLKGEGDPQSNDHGLPR